MRRASLVAVAALLAGCADAPPQEPLLIDLDAPAPIDLLPDPTTLPPGFHVGVTQSQKGSFEHLVDGHTRVLERNNATERQRLAVGVLLFTSPARAEQAFEQLTRSPSGQSGLRPILIGDQALHETVVHEHDPTGGRSDTVIARTGAYILWVSNDAHGAAPVVDAQALAREIVERAGA